jgi:hypothetical protein
VIFHWTGVAFHTPAAISSIRLGMTTGYPREGPHTIAKAKVASSNLVFRSRWKAPRSLRFRGLSVSEVLAADLAIDSTAESPATKRAGARDLFAYRSGSTRNSAHSRLGRSRPPRRLLY